MKSKAPNRYRPIVAHTVDPDLLERLNAWRRQQPVPPKASDCWEQAMVEFLCRQERARDQR